MFQGMCGRVDRPSELLWQMKVMLRRRDAWRKAWNKQPNQWRTLKHTSERKEWGRRGEGGRSKLSRRELFSGPYRAESITDQQAGHLSNAEELNSEGLTCCQEPFQHHTCIDTLKRELWGWPEAQSFQLFHVSKRKKITFFYCNKDE